MVEIDDDKSRMLEIRSLKTRGWQGLPRGAHQLRQSVKISIIYLFFIYLNYETIGTAATSGLLCQSRVIMKMIVESMMECRLAGETEVKISNSALEY
jgi:hypothetical protein